MGSGELNANVAVEEFVSGAGCSVTTVVGGVRSTVQSSVMVGGTPVLAAACTLKSCAPSDRPETVSGDVQAANAAPSSEQLNGPALVQANVADV